MLELKVTNQFRKDYKKVKKRGYDVNLLENVIQMLLEEKKLLLIYSIEKDKLILTASRTGTHSDLFR
ncbi:MAG: type II toxin-antitoxin system YafQ family toxin [Thermoflexaceae bacterium]|nr:type II toxin-antitoxin system YafQ family toxin [Thermoflexaceae bacterium]